MVHFSWEFPVTGGLACNANSTADVTQFLAFLQALRNDSTFQDTSNPVTLSATVSIKPWSGATDVSGFADVLDFITIMNYDIWGTWDKTVGPNAPLNDACEPTQPGPGSAESAVKAWTAAGMPAEKIVLGVPSYGRAYGVTPSLAVGASTQGCGAILPFPTYTNATNLGDKWAGTGTMDDTCGNQLPAGNTYDFRFMIQNGILSADGTPSSNVDYTLDNCSQTVSDGLTTTCM